MQPERSTSTGVVLEHQGACRLLCQPDGTISIEPFSACPDTIGPNKVASVHSGAAPTTAPSSQSNNPVGDWERMTNRVGKAYRNLPPMARVGVTILLHGGYVGGALGATAGFIESMEALMDDRPVNFDAIRKGIEFPLVAVAMGTFTGGVVLPITLAAHLLRMLVRPALLGVALHAGVGWLCRNHMGAAGLLRKLQSGDLLVQLEALRRIISRVVTSPSFRAQFKRFGGLEQLLQLLSHLLDEAERAASSPTGVGPVIGLEKGESAFAPVSLGLAGPHAALVAKALAELSRDADAAEALVNLGGVSVLLRAAHAAQTNLSTSVQPSSVPVHGSSPRSPPVGSTTPSTTHHLSLLATSMAALVRLTQGNAVAQQLLASEPEAGAVAVRVLTAASAGQMTGVTVEILEALRGHAVGLLQVLALEPAGQAGVAAAGGVDALACAISLAAPWSQAQAEAAAALHALVRADTNTQVWLAGVAHAGVLAAISRTLLLPPPAPITATGGTGVSSESRGAGNGCLPPATSHTARADLVALCNIMARHAVTPSVVTAPSPVPTPKAAPAPARQPLLQMLGMQRLRLRGPRATPAPPTTPAPTAVPPATPSTAFDGGASIASTTEISAGVSGMAPAAGLPDPFVNGAGVEGASGQVVSTTTSDEDADTDDFVGEADLEGWEQATQAAPQAGKRTSVDA